MVKARGWIFIADVGYADATYVWAATSDSPIYPDQTGTQPLGACKGVYRSADGGQNWVPTTLLKSPNTDPANCVYTVAPI